MVGRWKFARIGMACCLATLNSLRRQSLRSYTPSEERPPVVPGASWLSLTLERYGPASLNRVLETRGKNKTASPEFLRPPGMYSGTSMLLNSW